MKKVEFTEESVKEYLDNKIQRWMDRRNHSVSLTNAIAVNTVLNVCQDIRRDIFGEKYVGT